MAKADKKQIDIPASAASKKLDEDFVIHVMPKEFKGRSADVKKLPVAPKPVPPPAKIMPKPVPVKKTTDLKKKGRRSTLILILVGVIIVLIFLVSALFVLNNLQSEEPVIEQPIDIPDEPDEPIEVVDEPITQGLDTDSDGLTDVEEELYGTDFRNPDTDADSFLDGNEVFHRYDPIGYAPSTLLDTGSVEVYSSIEDPGYEIYYPRTWRVQESFDPGTGMTSQVEFISQTKATISISVFDLESDSEFADFGFEDKFTSYLYTDKNAFRFVYDVSQDSAIEYLQTFQMMVNSFILP